MNTLFNSALRQSSSLRKDLDALADSHSAPPALLGQISASLTSFSRTIDDYNKLAKQEIVADKQEKAFGRVKNFRGELSDFREQFSRLKQETEERNSVQARTELLGRRPHNTATPENPYSAAATAASAAQHSAFQPSSSSGGGPGGGYAAQTREQHTLREQTFMQQTNSQIDEFLERGRAVLGDLGQQREVLKGTQRKLYSVANTLGISGDTIRMVERRARQDKWVFWAGVVVFFVFCYFVLRWLR